MPVPAVQPGPARGSRSAVARDELAGRGQLATVLVDRLELDAGDPLRVRVEPGAASSFDEVAVLAVAEQEAGRQLVARGAVDDRGPRVEEPPVPLAGGPERV